jgi:superfamily II DNA or RNA helicase
MYKLRDYQVDIANKGVNILKSKGIVYYALEVRLGKTSVSLETARLFGAKKVLFLTKKKAISSIESDYINFGYDKHFELFVHNDESMHKIDGKFDLVVHDESHRFGSFPKPSLGAKTYKKMFGHLPAIFLSGTPSPENYSQFYHQFWCSLFSPFKEINFYKWAANYVNIKMKHLGYAQVKDYTDADINKIMSVIKPYIITFTQEQAGFTSEIEEEVLKVKMKNSTYEMCERLRKDLVIEGKNQVILADTSVKLQQKLHQMYSGTIKFESGDSMVIDHSKAEFIYSYFKYKKIGIFYKFVEELNALKTIFGDKLTINLDEFNDSDKSIALQIVSGREGISLKNADFLVFYNIDFSATSYWQARDRQTTIDRKFNKVYWIFSEGGIEEKIYKSVIKKKSYTTNHFKKDYL